MSKQGLDFNIPSALARRLTRTGDEQELLVQRHLGRARQCCSEVMRLPDECAPSTRVLVAYLVLLHGGLAVLAASRWRVAPCDSQADAQVLEILAPALGLRTELSEGMHRVVAAREAELRGVFANERAARLMQSVAIDVHGLVELHLGGCASSA